MKAQSAKPSPGRGTKPSPGGEGGSPRSHARGETDEVAPSRSVHSHSHGGRPPPHPPFGHLPLKGKATTPPLCLPLEDLCEAKSCRGQVFAAEEARREGGSPRSHARGETDEVAASSSVRCRSIAVSLPPHPSSGLRETPDATFSSRRRRSLRAFHFSGI